MVCLISLGVRPPPCARSVSHQSAWISFLCRPLYLPLQLLQRSSTLLASAFGFHSGSGILFLSNALQCQFCSNLKSYIESELVWNWRLGLLLLWNHDWQCRMDVNVGEAWKSLFPIDAVFKPPLLLSGPSAKSYLGPLIFNPILVSPSLLFSSPSLLPPPSPPPFLNLHRFLLTSSTITPSAASAIASHFGNLQPHGNSAACALRFNRLQYLRCHNANSFILFFPTGPNSDQIGFILVSVKASGLEVNVVENDGLCTAESGLKYQIYGISINPISYSSYESSSGAGNSYVTIGYLLAFTMYSVDWFVVRNQIGGSNAERVGLDYVGSKIFKTCSIVHACWSPLIYEESVVLLENGELFLFNLEPLLKKNTWNSNVRIKGTKLKVSWVDCGGSKTHKWFACDFSWHPRILIVASSDSVFLVDVRLDQCSVSCLMKIEMFQMYALTKKEQFIAFSKSGSDGFHFVLATNSLLLLCDVRKPLLPVLQWVHGLDKPHYINVLRLSALRSNSKDSYSWANESGVCILLGSFCGSDFAIFCYGPSLPASSGSVASKMLESYDSFYAWELPSSFLLNHGCPCGSCLIREEMSKDELPAWIQREQRMEGALGFGILDEDLAALISPADENGGVTLIRLMSSGTIDSQRYCASWNPSRKVYKFHNESFHLVDHLPSFPTVVDFKFPKRFKYLKLDFLMGYLNGNLTEVMDSSIRKTRNQPSREESDFPECHAFLCEKMAACGFNQLISSPAIRIVFNDISLPVSLHEVTLRRMWAGLPMEILQLSFSNYTEFPEVPFEYLTVPNLVQLPPFFLRSPANRSNKWSKKVRRTNAFVGPTLPLPTLVVLHELHYGGSNMEEETQGFSLETEFGSRYSEVKRVASELAFPRSQIAIHDDCEISLADDREDMCVDSQEQKPFVLYSIDGSKCSTTNQINGNSTYKDEIFDSLMFKLSEETLVSDKKPEIFDGLCPVDLRFDTQSINFGPQETKAYKLLKRQLSKWQDGFDLYKGFCTDLKLCKKET